MRPILWPAAACCALAASPAFAQVAGPRPAVAAVVAEVQPAPPSAAPTIPAPAPQPLAADELSGLTGRQGSNSTILSDQDLTAINNGNTITARSVSSGQILIGPGAFEGFAGVGNFVINSGHNNNLQGAITINVVSPQ